MTLKTKSILMFLLQHRDMLFDVTNGYKCPACYCMREILGVKANNTSVSMNSHYNPAPYYFNASGDRKKNPYDEVGKRWAKFTAWFSEQDWPQLHNGHPRTVRMGHEVVAHFRKWERMRKTKKALNKIAAKPIFGEEDYNDRRKDAKQAYRSPTA